MRRAKHRTPTGSRWALGLALVLTVTGIGCRRTGPVEGFDLATLRTGKGPTIMLAAYVPQIGTTIQLEWQNDQRAPGQVFLEHELVNSALVPGMQCAVLPGRLASDRDVAHNVYISTDGKSYLLLGRANGAYGQMTVPGTEPGAAYLFCVRQAGSDEESPPSSPSVPAVMTQNLVIDGGFEQAIPGLVEHDIDLPDWELPKRCQYEIGVYPVKGLRGDQFLSLLPPVKPRQGVRFIERMQSKNIRVPKELALLQSGWVRCPGGQSRVYIGRAFYDAEANLLGETFSLRAAAPRQWTFFSQRLVPSDARPEDLKPIDARIPKGTAFVRWTLRVELGGEGVQMDELAIQPVPSK